MSLNPALIGRMLDAHVHLRRLWVAYSGGVDSHVLLHWLATQRDVLAGRTVLAVYVDHGLHPASSQWGQHCQAVCQALQVGFHTVAVDARPAAGEGPEAAARRARYGALEVILGEGDALLTAHHRNDQAETLLVQLLRGAGPHGLAAMPASAPLGRGLLLRPLLDVDRTEILGYAKNHGLIWVEDSSNAYLKLDRNYVRHEILPRLNARWPSTTRTLARSARWCAETAELLDALADEDLARAAGGRPACLRIPALRLLAESRQRNALRHWFRRLDLPSPTAAHLDHILRDALGAPRDRQPLIRWPGCEVRRYHDLLYAMAPLPAHDPGRVFPVTLPTESVVVPGIGCLHLHMANGAGICVEALHDASVTVRFRRGGERFQPSGRRHAQTLKHLLQEAGVPPWERDRLPLVYVNDVLAAVVGVGVAAEFAPAAGGSGLAWILRESRKR